LQELMPKDALCQISGTTRPFLVSTIPTEGPLFRVLCERVGSKLSNQISFLRLFRLEFDYPSLVVGLITVFICETRWAGNPPWAGMLPDHLFGRRSIYATKFVIRNIAICKERIRLPPCPTSAMDITLPI
jgi:hypothetical protein